MVRRGARQARGFIPGTAARHLISVVILTDGKLEGAISASESSVLSCTKKSGNTIKKNTCCENNDVSLERLHSNFLGVFVFSAYSSDVHECLSTVAKSGIQKKNPEVRKLVKEQIETKGHDTTRSVKKTSL